MIGFVFNPPRGRGRRIVRRKVSRRRVARRTVSRGAMAWKRAVKKFGVRGAAERRMKRRAAARRARRTLAAKAKTASKPRVRRIRRRKVSRKVVVPMARSRKARKGRRRSSKRARAARRGWAKRRAKLAARKGSRRRRSRKMKANPVRRRRSRRSRRGGRRFTHRTGRRAARKAWRVKPGRRAMVKYARHNVRRALNKKFGIRKWIKHSRAKWNPGQALSIGGAGSSITSVFRLENLYDGLAIGGGIIGALALPRLVDKVLPAGLKSKLPFGISLTTGWFSYVASAGSAGLLGYLAGVAFGRRYGEKVFWGGIGATLAKVILDYVGPVRNITGVQLSAYDSGLAKAIEQEVAAELRAGGGMAAYVSPSDLASARPLGDYVSPEGILGAKALGGTDEFGEGNDFEQG